MERSREKEEKNWKIQVETLLWKSLDEKEAKKGRGIGN